MCDMYVTLHSDVVHNRVAVGQIRLYNILARAGNYMLVTCLTD